MDALANRIGFRLGSGLSECVLVREVLPSGMTLLDLREIGIDKMHRGNLAERQEVREMITAMHLQGGTVDF